MMRTTLNVDEELLQEVVCLTGEKDKGRAINTALTDFIRRARLAELRALAGNIEIDNDLAEMKELELKKMREREWS